MADLSVHIPAMSDASTLLDRRRGMQQQSTAFVFGSGETSPPEHKQGLGETSVSTQGMGETSPPTQINTNAHTFVTAGRGKPAAKKKQQRTQKTNEVVGRGCN
jgi:hypothetical protein